MADIPFNIDELREVLPRLLWIGNIGTGVAPGAPNSYLVDGCGAPGCVEEFRQKNSSRLRGKASLFGGGFKVERGSFSWHNMVISLVEFVCGRLAIRVFLEPPARFYESHSRAV